MVKFMQQIPGGRTLKSVITVIICIKENVRPVTSSRHSPPPMNAVMEHIAVTAESTKPRNTKMNRVPMLFIRRGETPISPLRNAIIGIVMIISTVITILPVVSADEQHLPVPELLFLRHVIATKCLVIEPNVTASSRVQSMNAPVNLMNLQVLVLTSCMTHGASIRLTLMEIAKPIKSVITPISSRPPLFTT